jgi:carbon storage regulator
VYGKQSVASAMNKKESTMLVLSRKAGEAIVIDEKIIIKVIDVQGGRVRIGIVAPKDINVNREEVQQAIDAGKKVPS